MTPEQRAELRRLCEEASRPPWGFSVVMGDALYRLNPGNRQHVNTNKCWIVGPQLTNLRQATKDGVFCDAARTALPALLDYVETLEQLLHQKRDQVRRIRKEARDYKKWKDFNTFMELRERIRKLEETGRSLSAIAEQEYKLTITIEATAPAAVHGYCGKGSTVAEAVWSLGEMMAQAKAE